ncbi:MAG: ABC transporter permease [Chloroflexota bacterium]
MKGLLAQTAMELRLTARRGENLLLTLIIPLVLMLFFGSTHLIPLARLVPGILALAIMSTGMVSLGIATAYERLYGVLKRLGGSPLTRPRLIVAKIVSVIAVEALQIMLVGGLAALAFGWRPGAGVAAAVGLALLGTATFTGLGLLIAGSLRAEATLVGLNGLYIVFLLLGGIFVPVGQLPQPLGTLATLLPATALTSVLRSSLGVVPFSLFSLIVLAVWGVVAILLTSVTFRWE